MTARRQWKNRVAFVLRTLCPDSPAWLLPLRLSRPNAKAQKLQRSGEASMLEMGWRHWRPKPSTMGWRWLKYWWSHDHSCYDHICYCLMCFRLVHNSFQKGLWPYGRWWDFGRFLLAGSFGFWIMGKTATEGLKSKRSMENHRFSSFFWK